MNEEERVKMSGNHLEVVQLAERKFVGIPATSSLHKVTGIGEAHKAFMQRRGEIRDIVNEDRYVCVHFANEVLFTYIYSMEVTDLRTIPEGMIGFAVPSHHYVQINTNGEEPYGLIKTYVKENDLKISTDSVSFEIFKFGEEESKYHACIQVPVIFG
jgi:predicted transcriptional regulator YdeE